MTSNKHTLSSSIFVTLFISSQAGCLDPSRCTTIFPTSIVNMSQLCNDGYGYKFTNTTTGLTYKFEICGNIDPVIPSTPSCGGPGSIYPCTIPGQAQTNTYCNPEYNAYPFEGSFMTFFDPNPAVQCVRGGCPKTGFFTPTLQKLGQKYCCTGQCEIIDAASTINVEFLTGNRTGIQWASIGPSRPDNGDGFQCPIDPYTGNARSPTITYIMYCNANGTIDDPLQTLSAYDDGSCRYTLVMSHFVACGTLFPSPSPSPSPTSSPSNTPSTSPSTSPSSSITPLPTPSNSPSPSSPSNANNLNSFATSIPLITSMSLASFFGSIVFAGIAIYCCNRLRTYGDDDAQNEPLLPDGVAKPSRLNKSIPKLNQVQAAARLNPAAGIGSGGGGGGGGGGDFSGSSYQDGGLTDEQIYIRRLPKKFKEYLEKQGAVDLNTGSVLKQIPIKEDQLMKIRALGVSNVILTELESTYKVISFSEA